MSIQTLSLSEVIESAKRNSLSRDNPLLADLPGWFEGYRDHQRIAVREILTAYEEGVECVVLDAPTGSGKTLIGETVRRLLSRSLAGQCRGGNQTTYICSSKALQDQFLRDYPYAKVLKGRSNYPTESYPERFGGQEGLSCADCTKSPGDSESCMWCPSTHTCPYEQAKSGALRASLAVLNTSYFLSECNGPGRFSRGGLVICDEADVLESELMGHVEVRISERRLKQYGLGTPRFVTKEESWREWAEEALGKVRNHPLGPIAGDELKAIRERKRHAILLEKLRTLRDGLESGDWVFTGTRQEVAFKPITVSSLGQSKFWQHGDKFLLMSATVISADEMLESLGWDEDKSWRLVKCPSTFKPENRKVIVWPVASMTYKERDSAWPEITKAVVRIASEGECGSTQASLPQASLPQAQQSSIQAQSSVSPTHSPIDHTAHKILIHSSSYALTAHISDGLRRAGLNRPIYSYAQAAEKESALVNWQASQNGIMVAPSLDRGVDLPGDACRIQIIVKVPFLSLKDKQVSGRLYGGGRAGKVWYAVNAIRTLVQMTGRAVRSEEDWAVSYILDAQFVSNVWGNYKRLCPEWWREGIVWKMKGL